MPIYPHEINQPYYGSSIFSGTNTLWCLLALAAILITAYLVYTYVYLPWAAKSPAVKSAGAPQHLSRVNSNTRSSTRFIPPDQTPRRLTRSF